MVQKGNPHQLPIRQHVFPAKSISRFCGKNNGVEVRLIAQDRKIMARPTDPPFIVNQMWDAKAEGHFKDIEDDFQKMIEGVKSDGFLRPNRFNHEIAVKMYASWYVRAHFTRIEDQRIKGVLGPSRALSEDEREQLERAGITTLGADCTIAGRQLAWPTMLHRMDEIEMSLTNRQWGVLTADIGEFVVPDKPPRDYILLPLSPRQILYLDSQSQTVPLVSVQHINRIFSDCSSIYYFGRDLSQCPGL